MITSWSQCGGLLCCRQLERLTAKSAKLSEISNSGASVFPQEGFERYQSIAVIIFGLAIVLAAFSTLILGSDPAIESKACADTELLNQTSRAEPLGEDQKVFRPWWHLMLEQVAIRAEL